MPRPDRTLLIALAPAAGAAMLAVALASLTHPYALRLLLDAVAVVALAAAAWRASVLAQATDEAAEPVAPSAPVTLQRIVGDRRRPTIDRDTGMLADWYFRLRVEEELARAQRYGQRFTLLRLSHGDELTPPALGAMLRMSLRSIDLAGAVGEQTCVLLPNTDRAGAEPVAARLQAMAPGIDVAVTECPTEAATLAAVLGEEQWTSSQLPWPDASAA